MLLAAGQREEALDTYRKRLAAAQTLADRDKANAEWQRDLFVSYGRIGYALAEAGRSKEALASYRKGFAVIQPLADRDKHNVQWQNDLAIVHMNIGNVLTKAGRRNEALDAYRKSLAIRERLADSDKGNVQWQRDLGFTYANVGAMQATAGELNEALAAFQKSLAILQQLPPGNTGDTQWRNNLEIIASQIGNLAYRFILVGDFGKALASIDQAISLAPEKTWLYVNRAHALMFAGRVDEARTVYLHYCGTKNVQNDKSWEAVALEDFAEFRHAGLTHPLMDEIEKKLDPKG